MEAKELRIGNLIERNGVIAKIELINNEIDEVYFIGCDFYYSDFCCNINPIPLTKELILKFGFEFVNSKKQYGWYIEVGNRVLCWCHSEKISLEFKIHENHYYNDTLFDFDCKYVHQLQNLYFALTGEELTIK